MKRQEICRVILTALALVAAPAVANAQTTALFDTQPLQNIGWRGFLDYPYILESFASLVLATVLGALIAFHPMTRRTVDTLEEAELPKVYIMYALVGAVVGVTVLKYGLVVGLVVFGLGGLMRFRTDTESTRDTGRLILVTLIGLISGLNLPHFAVLAALFAFGLIFVFDANPMCRVAIEGLPGKRAAEAASLYRQVLVSLGCTIMSEKKAFTKREVEFVFRMPRTRTKEYLQTELQRQVPEDLRGEIDWEVE
jgi:hypothetical protein